VIGASAQDVQISGSMTGSHVGAYPSALLTNEGIPRFLFGDMISGATFFSYLFFRSYKEKVHTAKRRNQNIKELKTLKIDWMPACAGMTKFFK